jgi:diacylglycerol kinase
MESKDNIKEGQIIEIDKIKKRGIKRFFNSIKNSINGLKYAYIHEQSLTLHAFLTILVLVSGFYFHISKMQWAILVIVMTIIIVTELINTAIEATVDLVTNEYHNLAKIAKDCASAAAFVSSLLALSLYLYVFLPKIIGLF